MDTFPAEHIELPYVVPYAAQIASEELAGDFFDLGRPLASDPRWADSGAASPEEYAYWANRACGMACVKMCVQALGGPDQPLMDWVQAGLALGGYYSRDGESGERVEVGWLHACLADLIRPYAAQAYPKPVPLNRLVGQLRAGRLVIASVSYQIGTIEAVTRRGGHLVVLTGAELLAGRLAAFRLHNPSGRTPELRRHALIPAGRFSQAYSGRAILITPRS